MKAKVKETGRIVDVEYDYANASEGNLAANYKVKDMPKYYSSSELDFNDIIDWEERRFLIAKDVLAGFSQNNHPQIIDADSEMTARWAVSFADELIKQLKSK